MSPGVRIVGGGLAARVPCRRWHEEHGAEIAPDVFRIDDVAIVIGTGPDSLILEAAEACPSVAISVVDHATGETVYP